MRNRPKANAERRTAHKKTFARKLREDMTDYESKLWSMLRCKQMAALRFRRQQPVGPYIADFMYSAAKLIVELDGRQHGNDEAIGYDEVPTQ